MTYSVYHSVTFDKQLENYPIEFKEWLDKVEEKQLTQNPYVGDPLNVRWFREKKYGKFRVYYLIYDDPESVYMVAISAKKDQQKIIDTIRLLVDELHDDIKTIVGKK